MDSPDRYTQVWNAVYAEFLAKGMPEDQAKTMASELAAAQILAEVRAKFNPVPPPLIPAAPAGPPPRKLRMAKGDGIGLVVMGVFSVITGALFRDFYNASAGLLIVAFGVVELAGLRCYLARKPAARRLLVGSQAGVLLLVWAYCAMQLVGPSAGQSPETADLMRQMGADAAEFAPMFNNVARITYLSAAALSLLYQGGLGYYYWKKTEP